MHTMEWTIEELESEQAHLLPEREALAFVNVANIWANNQALALNVASINSFAAAAAVQHIAVAQW